MPQDSPTQLDDPLAALVARHGLGAACEADLRALLERALQQRPAGPMDSERDGSRYAARWFVGEGATSEVFRIYDTRLRRSMVMKVLKPAHASSPEVVSRFIAEAQISAQLQHPNLVPIYDLDRGPDGRLYFAMREVIGETLDVVISAVHEASGGGRWGATPDGWTLRRLIDALHQISQAVAYAHSRGVLHRDLKPENVMIGDFGEVLLLDWGLARSFALPPDPDEELPPVTTDRDLGGGFSTLDGAVAGTPAYMAPEQAEGEVARHGPATDVYALGAILYQILSGRPPYDGPDGRAILEAVRRAPPPPLASVCAQRPPAALAAICERAMRRDPRGRYPDGRAFAAALQSWLLDLALQPAGQTPAASPSSPGRAATPDEAAEVIEGLRDPIWSELLRAEPAGIFRLEDGEPLCRAGELDRRAWVLLRGALEVELDGGARLEEREGAFIGEIALFADAPRTATVRAVGGAWVRAFDPASFERVAGRHPAVAMRLIRTMAERLAQPLG